MFIYLCGLLMCHVVAPGISWETAYPHGTAKNNTIHRENKASVARQARQESKASAGSDESDNGRRLSKSVTNFHMIWNLI